MEGPNTRRVLQIEGREEKRRPSGREQSGVSLGEKEAKRKSSVRSLAVATFLYSVEAAAARACTCCLCVRRLNEHT